MSGAVIHSAAMPTGLRPIIFGSAGPSLSADEIAFFRAVKPLGFILFARNIVDREQVRRLVAQMRDCVGYDAPVLIDQEGGRVARLKGDLAHSLPPMARLGELALVDPVGASDAAWAIGRLLAHDLAALDIWVDCVPVLDVPVDGSHDVIGDRALARTPAMVEILGRSLANGALAGGCLPVIKHIPGHGRAGVDSHHALPVVDAPIDVLRSHDFRPFKALADLPMAMTAHVLYTALDAENPATLSPVILAEIIRGEMGFSGLVMTDDLSMGALGGTLAARARNSLKAGCDVLLHCNGQMAEMVAIADSDPQFSSAGLNRAKTALDARKTPDQTQLADLLDQLGRLLPGLVH
jgi:beta-N-acetylhexosaminidase